MSFNYEKWAEEFHRMADESNDSMDHDELHAAGDICYIFGYVGFAEGSYIHRWLEGLAGLD